MAIKRNISAIVNEASKSGNSHAAANILKAYGSQQLCTLLRMALDAQCKWAIPEGYPPYKTAYTETENPGMLYSELRRITTLFLAPECGGRTDITPMKREKLFIELLGSLDPPDAKFLLDVRHHKLPPGIDVNVVREAFPGLI